LIDKTDPFAFAAQLKELIERYPDLPKRELAERMEISTQRLGSWLALNNTIEPIRELYRRGEIGRIICVRAGYLRPSQQVNYIERIIKRQLLPLTDESIHLLSLYIPAGQQRYMTERFGHRRIAVRLHEEGATYTWRFADANQMMLAVQEALAMGLMKELPRYTTVKVV
jgi:hypothetical protein